MNGEPKEPVVNSNPKYIDDDINTATCCCCCLYYLFCCCIFWNDI